jgi:hypothetical protein
VRKRLEEIPPIRFFTDGEARTLAAITERIVPQPDRSENARVAIVPWIDEKLYEDRRDGYRYEELPPQREAWRLGLKGIDETAHARRRSHGSRHAGLAAHVRGFRAVLRRGRRGAANRRADFLPLGEGCGGIRDSASGLDLARGGDRALWLVPLLMLAVILLGLARVWKKMPFFFALLGITLA